MNKVFIASIFTPLLMFCVAAAQHLAHHKLNLVPWKGGGFGMFSTVDGIGSREIRVHIKFGDEKFKSVRLPRFFPGKLRDKIRAIPLTRDLRFAALGLKNMFWVRDPDRHGSVEAFKTKTEAQEVQEKLLEISSIKIEVWRTHYRSKNKELSSSKVTEYTLERQP